MSTVIFSPQDSTSFFAIGFPNPGFGLGQPNDDGELSGLP